jgi:hypothetical protein
MKYVYKITYPNGKIYVGVDVVGKNQGVAYFGSPSGDAIEKDFTPKEIRKMTITKEVIWESETAPNSEVLKKELELIRGLGANNPAKGYNKKPKFVQ